MNAPVQIEPSVAQSLDARLAAASAASDARQWEKAAELWDQLCLEAPHDARCWSKCGEAFYQLGRYDHATDVLEVGLSQFPHDPWIAYHYTQVAVRENDWVEVLGRADQMRERFSDFWQAWTISGEALAALGRNAEAAARFSETTARFPAEFWPHFIATRHAAQQANWSSAIRLWSDLLVKFPSAPLAVEHLQRAVNEGARIVGKYDASSEETVISDVEYRCPTDLVLTAPAVKRVMVLGSCLAGGWPDVLEHKYPGSKVDFFLVNNVAQLPERPPVPPEEYDFHVVQIPLRQVLPEQAHFRIPFSDAAAYEALFEASRERLLVALDAVMQWNRAFGIPTFVCNFLLPQQNPMGRLLPRYELRNFVHFVEKLNEVLAEELRDYKNAYLFDLDQVVSTFGRRYVQDDAVWMLSHGAVLSDAGYEHDQARLEKLERVTQYYPGLASGLVQLAWAELIAMHRTLRQTDMVKLVLVDLDDTLWRGVVAEQDSVAVEQREGWPIGLAEALMFLKRRGVLLGVVSKNDETRVRDLWMQIYGDVLRPEDFAITKINWTPKADNIEEILGQ